MPDREHVNMKKFLSEMVQWVRGWGSLRYVFYVLLFELLLAYFMPPTVLHDILWLNYLVDAVQHIAPVIGKFNLHNATHPDAVRLYLAITLFLVIPKTIAIYGWLNRDRNDNSSQFVISPLTDTHAGTAGEWVTEPLRHDKEVRVLEERSLASRIIWSLLIIAVTAGILFAFLDGGSPDSQHLASQESFRNVGSGYFRMWMAWSIMKMTLASLLLAISIFIARDYIVYFKRLFWNKSKGE
jgi:hypothetical protein